MFRKNEKPMKIKVQLTPDEVKRAVIEWLEQRDDVTFDGGPVRLHNVTFPVADEDTFCEILVDVGDQSG